MTPNKFVSLFLLVLGLCLYFVFWQIAELVFDAMAWPVRAGLPLPQIIALLLAFAGYLVLYKHNSFKTYLLESMLELSKVVYPTRKESAQSAVVVVAMLGIATIVLALVDNLWSIFTGFILS